MLVFFHRKKDSPLREWIPIFVEMSASSSGIFKVIPGSHLKKLGLRGSDGVIIVHAFHNWFKPIGRNLHIVIEEDDVVTGCMRNSFVVTPTECIIFWMPYDDDLGICFAQPLGSPVTGSIISDYYFEIAVVGGEDRR